MILSDKMKPETFDDVVGQSHLVGERGILRSMLNGRFSSFIMYGPSGCGKTSIARAMANMMSCEFEMINASTDDKKVIVSAIERCSNPARPGVVFIDEIHRLDKAKQDYLLGALDNKSVKIIGATTENVFMSIRGALRSRLHMFELQPLSNEDIFIGLKKAANVLSLADKIDDKILYFMANKSKGDLRVAYRYLELYGDILQNNLMIDDLQKKQYLEQICGGKFIDGDSDGNMHYDLISALQKSIRGSDVDASLYYLAHLIEIGDLPILIRRLTIILYEDIGLANPGIFTPVMQAIESANTLGFPEARIPLSVAVSMMAISRKSNHAYKAIDRAIDDVHMCSTKIPAHLRDAHYDGARTLGSGVGYLYSHDYAFHIVKQQYLPDNLRDKIYLDLSSFIDEKGSNALNERLDAIRSYLRS